jgi:hypothetical protein
MPERKIAMTRAKLRLVEETFINNTHALDAAVPQIERAFRKCSIVRRGKSESAELGMIEAIEPDADLFTVAEQVDLAEKDFHDAVARRNEAHIEYLRQPRIETRETFKAAKAGVEL